MVLGVISTNVETGLPAASPHVAARRSGLSACIPHEGNMHGPAGIFRSACEKLLLPAANTKSAACKRRSGKTEGLQATQSLFLGKIVSVLKRKRPAQSNRRACNRQTSGRAKKISTGTPTSDPRLANARAVKHPPLRADASRFISCSYDGCGAGAFYVCASRSYDVFFFYHKA